MIFNWARFLINIVKIKLPNIFSAWKLESQIYEKCEGVNLDKRDYICGMLCKAATKSMGIPHR